jgi:hypothetical protein
MYVCLYVGECARACVSDGVANRNIMCSVSSLRSMIRPRASLVHDAIKLRDEHQLEQQQHIASANQSRKRIAVALAMIMIAAMAVETQHHHQNLDHHPHKNCIANSSKGNNCTTRNMKCFVACQVIGRVKTHVAITHCSCMGCGNVLL